MFDFQLCDQRDLRCDLAMCSHTRAKRMTRGASEESVGTRVSFSLGKDRIPSILLHISILHYFCHTPERKKSFILSLFVEQL